MSPNITGTERYIMTTDDIFQSAAYTAADNEIEYNQTANSPKQSKRRIEILEAARQILALEGYTKFTMRRVAAKAAIQLKSLQRLFPAKSILLKEVIEHTINNYYFDKYASKFENSRADTPKDKMLIVIDHLLKDLRDPFTTHFFPELWALALHDEDATKAMDTLYVMHRKNLSELITLMNPSISRQTVAHRATMVAMTIEGLLLMVGDGKPQHDEFEGLNEEVKARILDIIMAP